MTHTDLAGEQRKVRHAALLSLIVCSVAFAAGFPTLSSSFDFPTQRAERIAFALRADLFILLWVFLGVGLVAHGRRHSPEDIGGAISGPPSRAIAVRVAFLQNTLEQAVLAVGAHLALATLLSGPRLALIAIAVILFGVGRAAFLIGYRKGAGGRAFGMVTTALPSLAGFALAIVLTAAEQ